MDIPDHKVNPVCSRRWRQEGVFKGQSGQDSIRYFEMITLGYNDGWYRSKSQKESW